MLLSAFSYSVVMFKLRLLLLLLCISLNIIISAQTTALPLNPSELMGNDGGSIPGRQELVKTKKQKRHLQKDLMAKARSTMCALTKEALRSPVVVC